METNNIDPVAQTLTHAIAMQEGGGKLLPYDAKSGDVPTATGGRYQFMPDTWKNYAQQVLGDANAPMTDVNQNKVAYTKVKQWLDSGKTPAQASAMWNAGEGAPDAWKPGTAQKVGNTPQYVKNVQKYAQQLSGQSGDLQHPPTQSLASANLSQNGYAPPVAPSGANQTQSAQSGGYAPPTPPSTSVSTDTNTPPPTPPKSFMQQAGDVIGGVGDFLFPAVGDVSNLIQGKNTKSAGQIAGDVGLSALPFIPGLGGAGELARGAGLAERIAASPIARGALSGYGMGVSSNLAQGQDLGQSAGPNLNTVLGTLSGGVLNKLLGRAGSGVQGLRSSAAEDISQILSPTTKENKQITQKIAPRLAAEGTTAMTREGLLAKYEANMGKVGDALEAEYEKLPANAKIDVSGLFESLNRKIDSYTVNGIVPSAAKSKVAALQGVMKDLANIGVQPSADGTQVFADVANVRALRQIVDENIGKGFAFTDIDTANRAAQKQLANGIREQFGTQYPNIAKLNKDFNFWSNASKVLSDAIERKTGQSGIIRKGIAAGLGMGGGASAGHPWIGAAVMKTLSDFMVSPAWHTTSALVKSKIANAFEKSDYVGAQKLIQTAARALPGMVTGATLRTVSPLVQTTNPQFSTPQQTQ